MRGESAARPIQRAKQAHGGELSTDLDLSNCDIRAVDHSRVSYLSKPLKSEQIGIG